jgi:hypothetical protein
MTRTNKEIDTERLIQAALAVAHRRRELLMRLRSALQANEVEKAITLAKELCGLDDQGCDRTDPCLH